MDKIEIEKLKDVFQLENSTELSLHIESMYKNTVNILNLLERVFDDDKIEAEFHEQLMSTLKYLENLKSKNRKQRNILRGKLKKR